MPKRGKLSNDDIAYIKANVGKLSVEEIAANIDRTIETVEKAITNHAPADAITDNHAEAERITIRQELRNSGKWKQLRDELTDDEITYFEEEYIGLMAQFKSDVLHTEVSQIFDAIKLEVLKNRNMVARRKAREDIERMEKMQEKFLSQFGDDPSLMADSDKSYALSLENQLNVARAQEQSKTVEWTKLQERVEKIRQALKANRDQRVKEVESRGKDFIGVIKWLNNRDVQQQAGRHLELTKLAGQREYDRLGELTEYEDGSVDSPILSAETVVET